jgi:hypothetical protein
LATASSAGRGDLVGHLLGRGAVAAGAVDRTAQVVDHHLGPFGGEEEGVLTADAATGPGDDGDPSVECTHVVVPPTLLTWRPRAGGHAGRVRPR